MISADSLADIHVTRRTQLRMLIYQRTAGNIAAFADQFGYSRSRVSQFLSDTYNEGRSIGERAARALEEVVGVPFGWLDQAADLPGKFSGNSTIDHTAELRGAIAQTRLVFEGHRDAQDALEYLEQVLKAGQRAEVPAHACTPAASQAICNLAIKVDTIDLERATALANRFNEMLQGWAPALAKLKDSITTTMSAAAEQAAAAMAAQSAQLVIQAEKAAAGAAARATVDPVAVLSRELFSLADKLQQPADLVVQLLVLAELRGMRAEQHHESAAGRANKDFVLDHKAIDAAKEWVAGAEYCNKLGMPPPDPSKLLEYLANPVAG